MREKHIDLLSLPQASKAITATRNTCIHVLNEQLGQQTVSLRFILDILSSGHRYTHVHEGLDWVY